MTRRPVDELARLLGHADQRVRLEAQYELADRAIAEAERGAGREPLRDRSGTGRSADGRTALGSDRQDVAKRPATGPDPRDLGASARSPAGSDLDSVLAGVRSNDPDAEVRAQAVRMLGRASPRDADSSRASRSFRSSRLL